MRITGLRLRNWWSYADLDLDLRAVSALAITGPNGSGKSLLIDAVTFALAGEARTSADSMIRRGEDECLVELRFRSPVGEEVVVTRRRTRRDQTVLTLVVDGQNASGHTIADTERSIVSTVGLSYRGLVAGPIMLQDQADALLRMTPAAAMDLLIEVVVDSDRIERLATAARGRASAEEAALAGIEVRVRGLAGEADARLARLDERDRAAADLRTVERDLAERRGAVELATARLAKSEEAARREEDLRATLTELAGRGRRLTDERKRVRDAIADGEKREAEGAGGPTFEEVEGTYKRSVAAEADALAYRTSRDGLARDARDAKTRLDDLVGRRSIVGSVPCGGIGEYAACRFLTTAPSEDEVALATARVEELAGRLGAVGPEPPDPRPIREEWLRLRMARDIGESARGAIRALPEQRQREQAILAELGAVVARYNETQAAAEVAAAAVAEREEATTSLASARAAVGELETRQAELTRAHASAEAALARSEEAGRELAALAAERSAREADAATWRSLALAWHRDGVPRAMVEAKLPIAEERANEVLARLPGGYSLRFATQRETRSGAIRQALDVLVETDGEEVSYAVLSGGERVRVALASRLGLCALLDDRAGRPIETLLLDEPLAALDAEGRAALEEAIVAIREDFGLIAVVSHSGEFNDAMPDVLDVARVDGSSTAVLRAA